MLLGINEPKLSLRAGVVACTIDSVLIGSEKGPFN